MSLQLCRSNRTLHILAAGQNSEPNQQITHSNKFLKATPLQLRNLNTISKR
jgi:hypothetical protein